MSAPQFSPALIPALALVLAFTGCGDSRAQNLPAPDPLPAAVYKAGHGLQLTAAGRQFLGLATCDVATRPFTGHGDAIAIPSSAVLHTIKGDVVYVANGDWFLRTPVTIGAADHTHVEITAGLYEGDVVVVHGVNGLSLAEIQALNGGVACADGH
jgi:hypothetical protein